MKKKANILTETIIFLILNLVFFSVLFFFLAQQGEGAVLQEEVYAKQIALLIDGSKPGMTLHLNMDKIKDFVESDFDSVVRIEGNQVIVKLSERGGYSYSFFSDYKIDKVFSDDGEKVILSLQVEDKR